MRVAAGLVLGMAVGCADDPRAITNISVGNAMDPDAATAPLDARVISPVSTDTGVSVPLLRCPAMWADCATNAPWRVLADAADFGSGASFEALAADLVLVRGGSASWRVVRFGPALSASEPASATSFAFPSGEWSPVGLARTQSGVAVLSCAPNRCLLLEASSGALLESSSLPSGFVGVGLAASGAALCAFGSGIRCLDQGAWIDAKLPAGEQVVSLVLSSPRSLALTHTGRVFSAALAAQETLPVWVEEAQVAGVTQLSVDTTRALFHGPSTLVERTSGSDTACELPAGIAATFLSQGGARRGVLTNDGDLLSAPDANGGFCRTAKLSLTAPVRAASSLPCGDLRVLTGTQLLGDESCALD